MIPHFLAYIISEAIPQKMEIALTLICFVMSLLVFLEILLIKNIHTLVMLSQCTVVNRLKIEYIKSVMQAKMYSSAEMMEAINNINQVGDIVSYPIVKLIWQSLVGVGAIVYLLMVNIPITLLLIFLLPWSYRVSSRKKQNEISDAEIFGESRKLVNDKVIQLFKNAETYKGNLIYDYQLDSFEKNINVITENQIERSNPQISSIAFFSMIPILGYFLFGISVLLDNITFQQYIVVIQYVTFVYAPVRLYTNNKYLIKSALSNYRQICEQIKQNKKSDSIRQVSFNRIATIHFAKPKYKQRVSIDIEHTLKAGTVFNLKAPCGRGKTTLMRMLMKLQPIDDGAILINNIDIKQVKESFLWEHIYYANQDIEGFSGAIIDNILIGTNSTSKDIQFYIEKYQLQELTKDLKWRKHISNFEQLTIEERKQIQIFKLLLANKDVYILDELETSLDSDWINKLDEIIKDKARTAIVIRITEQSN